MQIGVHEAIRKNHLQDRLRSEPGQLLAISPYFLRLRRLDSLNEIHRQHPPGAQLRQQVWNVDTGDVSEVLSETPVVVGFELEIQLPLQRIAKAIHRPGEAEHSEIGNAI